MAWWGCLRVRKRGEKEKRKKEEGESSDLCFRMQRNACRFDTLLEMQSLKCRA
jgi:hypothetical protein